MVGLPKVLYVTLVLIFIGSQVESDASNHRYNKGDIVPFYANKVGPFHNPQLVTFSPKLYRCYKFFSPYSYATLFQGNVCLL